MLKKIFYFIIISIHFSCFSIEEQLDQNIKIKSVPLRLTIFSPYTDLDLFSGEEGLFQKSNILLSVFYGKSDYLKGLGISAFFLNTSYDMTGFQFSAINRIGGEGNGAQFGIVNYSHEFHGFQFGAVNRTNNVAGIQLGIVNTADDLQGIQLGVVNIAKNVTGSQFGFINIAEDQTGLSFGLLSFLLGTGQAKLSTWYDSKVPFNVSMKAGRKYFYGIFEINFPNISENSDGNIIAALAYPALANFLLYSNNAYYTIGIGTQITFEPVWIGIEAKWRDLTDNQGKNLNFIGMQYSTLIGTTFDKIYDIFGVVSFNSPGIPGTGSPDILLPEKYFPNHNYTVSYGFGVQFLFAGIPNW